MKIAENVKPELKDIKGGIVPHHLLADGMIATIDFSHYLAPDKADKMDEITLKAVKDRDLNARISKQHSESTTSYFTMLFYK